MKKILVVEDEAGLREEIVDILSFEGYEVVQAEQGNAGLEVAKKEKPDLILCDVLMPEMDGFELHGILQKESTYLTIPFIFITALNSREDMRKGMEVGADDYITKPFTRMELLAAVATRLEKYGGIQNRISLAVDEIENDLKHKLDALYAEIEKNKLDTNEIQLANDTLQQKINDKEQELMNDALELVNIKNIVNGIRDSIERELSKKEIQGNEKKILMQLRSRLNNSGGILTKNWAVFQIKFNQLYPGYINAITIQYPSLTQYDLIFIVATKMGMNTAQIAELLNISDGSARKSRYRLKKKLGLAANINFLNFINSFKA